MMIETQAGLVRALPYMAMTGVVVGHVLGTIFIKLGSSVDSNRAAIFGIFGWQTLIGAGLFASGLVFYAWALKHLPLHMAQAVGSLQFVAVMLAAALFFGEAIILQKWLGIALILVGIVLVTR